MQLWLSASRFLALSLLPSFIAASPSPRPPLDRLAVLHRSAHIDFDVPSLHPAAGKHAFHRRAQSPSPIASAPATSPTTTAPSSSSAPALNGTKSACLTALAALNGQPRSPTGMSVCFSVGALDTSSGAFQTDLFLYQVAPAAGNWTTVDPKTLSLGLAYQGASIASESPLHRRARLQRRAAGYGDAPAVAAPKATLDRRTAGPVLVTNMSLVGKVDAAVLQAGVRDVTVLMTALSPTLTISALTASHADGLRDTLSTTEAAFVTGTFSDRAAAARGAALAKAKAVPFVMPGTSLGIFPTGLIVTAGWTVLLLGALAWGVWGKLKWRNAYRRRLAAAGEGGMVAPYERPAPAVKVVPVVERKPVPGRHPAYDVR